MSKTFGTPDCWPQLDWHEKDTSELQACLQLGGSISAEALALEAVRLAVLIEPQMNPLTGTSYASRILRSQKTKAVDVPDRNDTNNDNESSGESNSQKSPVTKRSYPYGLMDHRTNQLQTLNFAHDPPTVDVVDYFDGNPDIAGDIRGSGVFDGSYEEFLHLHAANVSSEGIAIELDAEIATEDIELINTWTADLPIQSHADNDINLSLGNQSYPSSSESNPRNTSHQPHEYNSKIVPTPANFF